MEKRERLFIIMGGINVSNVLTFQMISVLMLHMLLRNVYGY